MTIFVLNALAGAKPLRSELNLDILVKAHTRSDLVFLVFVFCFSQNFFDFTAVSVVLMLDSVVS